MPVNLTGCLEALCMVSFNLSIHSKAVNLILKRYKTKTQNLLFYDPNLTHRRGSGVNLTSCIDPQCMVSNTS